MIIVCEGYFSEGFSKGFDAVVNLGSTDAPAQSHIVTSFILSLDLSRPSNDISRSLVIASAVTSANFSLIIPSDWRGCPFAQQKPDSFWAARSQNPAETLFPEEPRCLPVRGTRLPRYESRNGSILPIPADSIG